MPQSIATVSSRRRMTVAFCAAVAALAISVGAQQPQPAPRPQDGTGRAGAPAPQPQVRGGYTEAATLPARIMEFKAEPATIRAGQSATLTWAVENPRSIAIEPGVGRAAAR